MHYIAKTSKEQGKKKKKLIQAKQGTRMLCKDNMANLNYKNMMCNTNHKNLFGLKKKFMTKNKRHTLC